MRRLVGLSLLAAALAVAGCGGEETTGRAGADLANGKRLFIEGKGGKQSCGSCHVLADAGTQGRVGPSLDDAFRFAREQGFEESTFYEITLDQIDLAAPPMPAGLVTGQDAVDVAAYVARCAAQPDPEAARAAGCPEVTAPAGGRPEEQGEALFASLGCQGCHSLDGSKGIGPTLEGVTERLDDEAVIESILDPDAEIAEGFEPGVMSATIKPGSVSREQAEQLLAFLKAQSP